MCIHVIRANCFTAVCTFFCRSALFVQQMTEEGSVLQCQGQLTKKLSFKPSNVLSKAHRNLTLAVRQRAVKGSRIKKYAETIDPEQVHQYSNTVKQ